MSEDEVEVIELMSDEEDDEAPTTSDPARSPSMLSTCSEPSNLNITTGGSGGSTPTTVNTETEETPSANQPRQSPPKMPPPSQRTILLNKCKVGATMKQSNAPSVTKFNIYFQTLCNTPAFSRPAEDDDSDSIVFEGEVQSQKQSKPSTSRTKSTATAQQSSQSEVKDGCPSGGNQSTASPIITPPPTPPSFHPVPSPASQNQGGTEKEALPVLAGQKRPASSEPVAHCSKRIMPHSLTAALETQGDSPSTVTSSTFVQVNRRETETTASASTSRERLAPDDLEVDFVTALNQYLASYSSYIKEQLRKKYDFTSNDGLGNATKKLKHVLKDIKPGRNCLRQVLNFHDDIDPRNFDREVKRLSRLQEEKLEQEESERLLYHLAEELRQIEGQIIELDELKKHQQLSIDEEVRRNKLAEALGKRFIEYKKQLGEGNDVVKELHSETLRKIHLTDVTMYGEVNDAVEKLLEARKEKYLHGEMDAFEEIPYPDFEDIMKVVTDTSSLHKMGLTKEESHKIGYTIYEFMSSKFKPRRIRDLHDHMFVWTNYSSTQFKEELKKDPACDTANAPLRLKLATNDSTAANNLQLAYDQFCACAKGEEEEVEEDLDESSDESDDEEESELTSEELRFIDNSEDVGNDHEVPKAPASRPCGSKPRRPITRSRSRSLVTYSKDSLEDSKRASASGQSDDEKNTQEDDEQEGEEDEREIDEDKDEDEEEYSE